MVEFVRRNRILLSSGCLLLLSLLLLSASVRSPDRRDPIRRALVDGLAPAQVAVTWLRSGAARLWSGYVSLVHAERENRGLRERIASLEQQLIRLGELADANRRLNDLLDFRTRIEGSTVGARVIGREPTPWLRSFTVDRGERDGIRKGMAVLSPQGVVGQVAEVNRITSRVLLLTDHNSGIDAVVQRTRARGIVQGALEEGCIMKYLRHGEDVQVGDLALTSGLDGIFPKGVLIGEVVELSRRDRGLLQVAVVQPHVALDRIEEVLIVDAMAERMETPP